MATLKHELWRFPGGYTFCLAGPDGDEARARLEPGSKLIWTVKAGSHVEAMSKYYAFQKWGEYTTMHPQDKEPYPEEWRQRQLGPRR